MRSNILSEKIEKITETKADFQKIKHIQDSFEKGTVFNDVGCAINNARDRCIAANILALLREGKSVFAVFGVNRAVTQEPTFKIYFENNK